MHETLVNSVSMYFVPTLIAGCILIGMIIKAIVTVVTSTSQEKSRREIAAYIAEGTLSPDQGERLLKADINRGGRVV